MLRAQLTTALLGIVLLACKASSPKDLDTALLVQVPEAAREQIDSARLDLGRIRDEIGRAQREVALQRDELDIVENEREVASARAEEAQARLELARERGADSETLSARHQDVEDAQAFRRWVETRIALQEARIDQAQADLERERAREELAKAHLQLLQAQALEDLGRFDTVDIDVAAYQRRVDRLELELGDAGIALEAAERRTELRSELVSQRAEAVPARFRSRIEQETTPREAAAQRREDEPE